MKISQDQKAANRRAILQAAVTQIAEKGFKSATMSRIAREAGVGEATIYNYFPTKEAILYAYYLDHMHRCVAELKTVPDFNTFTLQEQLQTLFDASLDLYLPHREFVAQTFRLVFLSPSRDWTRAKPIRSALLAAVQDMLAAAVEVGEIPEQVFEDLMGHFFVDAYIGAVHYWLSDTSEGFANSQVLIDRGLDLSCALLKAGIANKLFDIAVFLFKTHVVSRMDYFIDPLKGAGRIKRRFMEGMDDGQATHRKD
jgi:AcrR family transcriptional regulator